MRQYGKTFWRSVPFLRLLIPLTAGILMGFYCEPPLAIVVACTLLSFLLFVLFRFLPNRVKYTRRWIAGCLLNIVCIGIGALLCYINDTRNQHHWIGQDDCNNAVLMVTVLEPLTEKERSYKTIVKTEMLLAGKQWVPVTGKIILYLNKDSLCQNLLYGSRVLMKTNIRRIRNTAKPGGFDYQRYCAFQGIYHRAYLSAGRYTIIKGFYGNLFVKNLYDTRNKILSVLKKYIPGEKEAGVAEALLIGYRNDLDKDLVKAYSNTGVVHIIAISGLHLGMIYGLLIAVFNKVPKNRLTHWLKPVSILLVLWGFSLLTGAAASILRSAVMFSFIVAGESIGRRTYVYNTLAASAFFLLLYSPWFLWDAGFLLSYTAVLSIVVFMKPLYKRLYIKNKLLNSIWQLNAVTLSAQLLTLPLVLFYFHQFPNLFLFTNAVAVPLSGLILYAELLLLIVAPLPVNSFTGKSISLLIRQMNGYIERTASLPFSVTDNINISFLQAILLYGMLFVFTWWIFQLNQGPDH